MRVVRALLLASCAATACACGWLVGGTADPEPAPAGDEAGTSADAGAESTTGDATPCIPRTCADVGANCGAIPDGCGNVISDCGTCVANETCGAAGPNKCGAGPCTPKTCAAVGAQCGPASDGCGGVLPCGQCDAGSCTATNACECGIVADSCATGGGGMTGACPMKTGKLVRCATATAAVPLCDLCANNAGGTWYCCH
jgi:hypothetical protein